MLVVRMTFCKLDPKRIEQAKAIFNREIIPVMRDEEGNVGIRLLEPEDSSGDFISVSEWRSQYYADLHEQSGLHIKLLKRLEPFLLRPPVMKVYSTEEVKLFTGVF
ncbi:MAG: putative quinol monooxygenase [Candidatus Dadabacteria bacterium]